MLRLAQVQETGYGDLSTAIAFEYMPPDTNAAILDPILLSSPK